jgi:uncharacterized protein (DUF1684 family)
MDAEQHERMILAWRTTRQERLRAPSGWLTLVDRVALAEGDNELPFGTITIRGETAKLGERTLHDDDVIAKHEGKLYEFSRRGEEFAVRVKDPSAPARLAFDGLSYFPIDLAWRVAARFERYHPPRSTQHQYDTGAGPARMVPGAAHFSVAGRSLTLEPVLEEVSRRLYFLFGDESNREDTYPAGRFLYADMPDGDEVTLDFNMAFNPPCVFTAFASCPVIPAHSRLPVRIAAGEKRWPDPPR